MQIFKHTGVTTKNRVQIDAIDKQLPKNSKLFTTSYFRYSDGTLEAPTGYLYFKPYDTANVLGVFNHLGEVIKHPSLPNSYYLQLNTTKYGNGEAIFRLCDSLYDKKLVSVVEPVFTRLIKPLSDPYLSDEWNINNTGQYNGIPGADMQVSDVWDMGLTGSGVKVAVIDVGVQLDHPDLQANLLTGFDETGQGSNGGPTDDKYNAHGTECAGIVAEVMNTIGAVGVAYNARVIPIRMGYVLPPDVNPDGYISTNDSWQVNSFADAANDGADVLSNSWGGYGSPSTNVNNEIDYVIQNGRGGKGCIVLFAAGNDNRPTIIYPSSHSTVIAVGASCECDTRKRSSDDPSQVNPGVSTDPLGVSCDGEYWWGGNYGTGLDLMAPGVKIATTTLTSLGGYNLQFNGTSAATPNTAAVVALMLQANPNLTSQQAREILESNCDKVGGYTYQTNVSGQPNGTWSTDAGYGRVNACSAVADAFSNTSIAGNISLCSGSATYSILSAINGNAITWSATPNGIVNLSPNGDQVTVTRVSDGVLTLSATLHTNCTGDITITKTIQVGTPSATISGPSSVCPCTCCNIFSTINIPGATYNWTLTPSAGNSVSGSGSQSEVTITNPCTLEVQITTPCGTISASRHIFLKSPTQCHGGCSIASPISAYTITPNPAQNTVVITASTVQRKYEKGSQPDISNTKNVSGIKIIKIYNVSGRLTEQQSFSGNPSKVQINVSKLADGIYFVEISDGKYMVQDKLVISR